MNKKTPLKSHFAPIKRYESGYRCIECDAKVSILYSGKCEDCTEYFD